MEDGRAIAKGVVWFLVALPIGILAAGIYASVRLQEARWLLISLVILVLGGAIAAMWLGSVALLNLAVFGPILWLRSKISSAAQRER